MSKAIHRQGVYLDGERSQERFWIKLKNPVRLSGTDKTIDISNVPELLRLVEEVRSTNEPRMLRRDSEDMAILMPPAPRPKRRPERVRTKADYEAFLSSAGSWKDVDTDKLVEDIYESRRRSSRPPVEL